MTSTSSAPLVPLLPYALFRFLSAASTEEVHVRAGVGGQVATTIAGEELPTWAVSRVSKSRVFSSNPILSGMLVAFWSMLAYVGCTQW